MRVLIADDEAPLRSWLKRLLAEQAPAVEVVAEAADGAEALAAIERLRPDVAFLDIRMPELSGLEVAARIGVPCRIVFVTAYDEFALQAFEQAAVDYLLKPVSGERLAKTLERLNASAAATPEPQAAALMQELLEKLAPRTAAGGGLRWLRVGDEARVQLVDIDSVDYFKAADKYTEVHVGTKVWLARNSLAELEREMKPDSFWRIHRSLVVRVAAIAEARRDLMGRLWVHLASGGAPLPVSRAHAHLFNLNKR